MPCIYRADPFSSQEKEFEVAAEKLAGMILSLPNPPRVVIVRGGPNEIRAAGSYFFPSLASPLLNLFRLHLLQRC